MTPTLFVLGGDDALEVSQQLHQLGYAVRMHTEIDKAREMIIQADALFCPHGEETKASSQRMIEYAKSFAKAIYNDVDKLVLALPPPKGGRPHRRRKRGQR